MLVDITCASTKALLFTQYIQSPSGHFATDTASASNLADDVPEASDSDEERRHVEKEISDEDIEDAVYDDERLYADAGSIGS